MGSGLGFGLGLAGLLDVLEADSAQCASSLDGHVAKVEQMGHETLHFNIDILNHGQGSLIPFLSHQVFFLDVNHPLAGQDVTIVLPIQSVPREPNER